MQWIMYCALLLYLALVLVEEPAVPGLHVQFYISVGTGLYVQVYISVVIGIHVHCTVFYIGSSRDT